MKNPLLNPGNIESTQINVPTNITPNPYAAGVVDHLPTYTHPNHHHRLFMLTGIKNHNCDSQLCARKPIPTMEVRFSCPYCDFDLCKSCFRLVNSNLKVFETVVENPDF